MKQVDISVVIAAYNEESVITQSLQRIMTELVSRAITWEIICVNDGSHDRTGVLLDEMAQNDKRVKILHHRRNFGQGRALRTAFNVCCGNVIVTLDADLSYDPRYIFELVDSLEANNVEITLASPYTRGGIVKNVPFYRHMLSRWGNFYLARMSPYSISTSTSVVRAYRHEVLDSLVLTSDGMELQLEILMKAYTLGFRVCEIPAELKWDEYKKQNTKLRRVSKMRVFSTIQTYLFLGWLTRPAVIFLTLSWFLILPGLYMSAMLLLRIIERVPYYMDQGFIDAVSLSIQYVFQAYTYSFIIYGGILLVGMQVFSYALLMLQNKYYFEEYFRLSHEIKKNNLTLDCEGKEEE